MTELENRLHAALIQANQLIDWQKSVIKQLKDQLPDDLETVRPGLGQFAGSIDTLAQRDLVQIEVALELANIANVESVRTEAAETGREVPFWAQDVVDPAMMNQIRKG